MQEKQNARFEERIDNIDSEIDASQTREDELREIAREGIIDANENLAFEQKKQAELQIERDKELKRQQLRELGFSAIKSYTANVQNDPDTAVSKTLTDLSILLTGIKGLSTFYEGSDRLGDDMNPSLNTGKDDYIIRADKDEMIVDNQRANRMRSMGYDTRDKILDGLHLAERFKRGELTNDAVDSYIIGGGYQSNDAILGKLDNVQKAIENQPHTDFKYNDVERAITTITKQRNKVIRTHTKQSGIW